MSRPQFIFVGPSKTGSTWIFELLRTHNEIFVPVAKDIYFFDKFFYKGLDWYEKHFKGCASNQVAGELSHDYFSSKDAIDRIAQTYPHVKLICCLRNPFDRAISSYKYFQRNGLVGKNFQDEVMNHPEIFEEGLYYTHLSHIYSRFAHQQVLVLFFDDLNSDPQAFAKRIFNFIGVNDKFISPIIGQKVNQASLARSKTAARIVKKIAFTVRQLGFPNLVGYFKRNKFVLKLLFTDASTKSSLGNNITIEFSEDFIRAYEREISKLGDLLKKDFSSWSIACKIKEISIAS